jgi:hypothetical protein
MGLRCASCGYDNDPTRVNCHSCGGRLERGGQAAPPPSGYMHPTDVMKMKKPRQPREWGKYVGALVRLLILVGLVAAVVLAFLPPRDVPPPVEPNKVLAERLSSLVASSSMADSTRAFSVPASDIGTWLASSVVLKEQENMIKMKPERVYAVPGEGEVRVGVETTLPMGLRLYFEGCYEPIPEGGGYGLTTRRFSVGRLPLPWMAGLLVERQLDSLGQALAEPLGQLARASHIGITPETVTLRWSGQSR